MTVRYFEVPLDDLAPAIGSGVRRVFAVEGREWVHLLTPHLETAKLRIAVWRSLRRRREFELSVRVRKALRARMRACRRYRPRTGIVKRVEAALRGELAP